MTSKTVKGEGTPALTQARLDYSHNYVGPRSICTCGHTGDHKLSDPPGGSSKERPAGYRGQHNGSQGHGSCFECDCVKFTWAGYTPEFLAGLPKE
jgi:hypothetical protein